MTTRRPLLRRLSGADLTACVPTGESIATAITAVRHRPQRRRAARRRPLPVARSSGGDRIADRYLETSRDVLRGR